MAEFTPAQRALLGAAAMKESYERIEQEKRDGILKSIFSPDQLKQVDKWAARQNDPEMGRSEAIRRLVELGLASGAKGAKLDRRAVKKASKVIDAMAADLRGPQARNK